MNDISWNTAIRNGGVSTNILIDSGGRRGYIVRYFKEALNGNGEVHVINSREASSFTEADRYAVAPGVYEQEFIPFLLHYCVEHHIRAVISLFDLGLIILAGHKHEFAAIGVTVIVPDAAVVSLCQDKLRTAEYLAGRGFQVPKTYNRIQEAVRSMQNFDLFLPLVVKPRFGMGSIGLYDNIQTISELRAVYTRSANEMEKALEQYGVPSEERAALQGTLIQEKISGQEYSLDVICDLEGTYRNTIVKKKLAMRAGETDAAEIVDLPVLKETGRRLALLLRPVGVLDVDVIMKGDVPYILEMNPRFSGSFAFSRLGGVNLPEAIIYWLEQEDEMRETDSTPAEENERKAQSEKEHPHEENDLHLTGTVGVRGQKVLVTQIMENPADIAVRRSNDRSEILTVIRRMERYLTPSLTQRGVDLTKYAEKLGNHALVWAAFNRQNHPVGMIAVYPGSSGSGDGAGEKTAAYGTFLAVDPAYRGIHLGRRMFGIAMQELRVHGVAEFTFEVRQSNTAAIKMYLEQGCRIISIEGNDTYHMSLDLTRAA